MMDVGVRRATKHPFAALSLAMSTDALLATNHDR